MDSPRNRIPSSGSRTEVSHTRPLIPRMPPYICKREKGRGNDHFVLPVWSEIGHRFRHYFIGSGIPMSKCRLCNPLHHNTNSRWSGRFQSFTSLNWIGTGLQMFHANANHHYRIVIVVRDDMTLCRPSSLNLTLSVTRLCTVVRRVRRTQTNDNRNSGKWFSYRWRHAGRNVVQRCKSNCENHHLASRCWREGEWDQTWWQGLLRSSI